MRRAVESDGEDDGSGFPLRLRYAVFQRRARDSFKAESFSYAQLAREIHVTEQSVSRWIKGRVRPDWRYVSLLAKRLGCGAGWLIFGGLHGRPGTLAQEAI